MLGRIDREGPASVSDLAQADARAAAVDGADGRRPRGRGHGRAQPDPDDRRRALVSLTDAGQARINADRAAREGWLVKAIEELPDSDRETIERSVEILYRLADADV